MALYYNISRKRQWFPKANVPTPLAKAEFHPQQGVYIYGRCNQPEQRLCYAVIYCQQVHSL